MKNTKKPNLLFFQSIKYHGSIFASAIIPRLCATAFNFSQPFLLARVIQFLSTPNVGKLQSQIGVGLIIAYVIVYVGLAVGLLDAHTYLSLLTELLDILCISSAPDVPCCHNASWELGKAYLPPDLGT